MKNLIYVFFCSMILLVSCGKEELELIPETVETEVSGDVYNKTAKPFRVDIESSDCTNYIELSYKSLNILGYNNPSFEWQVTSPQGANISGTNSFIQVPHNANGLTEYDVDLKVTYGSGLAVSIDFCFEFSSYTFFQTCGNGGSSSTAAYNGAGGCGGVAAAFYLP